MFYHHIFNQLISKSTAVELQHILDLREERLFRQKDLLSQFNKPLLCFTMNIAGPVKQNSLIKTGFDLGINAIKKQLLRTGRQILHEVILHRVTGSEAYFIVDSDPVFLKMLCCETESFDPIGRIYDMDVLVPNKDEITHIRKIERESAGYPPRTCIICGKNGKACASRRIHPLSEIQNKTNEILLEHILKYHQTKIAEYATRALLYELSITPKPGLVDRRNSGSHKDMDFYSFTNSTASMWPYFQACTAKGQESVLNNIPPHECLDSLRSYGKFAENEMLFSTKGVNTHKGAIFTMGILAFASSRHLLKNILEAKDSIVNNHDIVNTGDILLECKLITKDITSSDFKNITSENAATAGEKLYVKYGIKGIRGQMEEGLPAVAKNGLPILKALLKEGKSIDAAGSITLLSILGSTDDTNMIHRGGKNTQLEESKKAFKLAKELSGCDNDQLYKIREVLENLDDDYIARNLSPGGSADLLAACWFLLFIEEIYG